MSTPTRRRLPIVLTVVGALVLGLGAVATIGWCSLMGCTVLSEPFEPDGAEATRARVPAQREVDALATRLAARHEVLASTRMDGCSTGQNNWKVKDTYSHECSVGAARVLAVAADDDAVAGALLAAHRELRAEGCESGEGLDAVEAQYWSADNPLVQSEGAAALPRTSYTCSPDLEVEVRPTSAREAGEDPGTALGSWFPSDVTLSGRPFGAEDAEAVRSSGAALALVVTVSKGYYRTEF
ncbi:hypothetical protein [Phycicoccus sonneratiae]|uniref:Lipoprotein n=1 Tax=Phycicoccus sonneratiae TaxID=2807628 RepID=A0ABS2CL21_9MICO|nr:hypothetical protein [Phycicoccus sonneraticus]MBM6400579.1 hypothetical protein [Phycicoccus sonneraticus]